MRIISLLSLLFVIQTCSSSKDSQNSLAQPVNLQIGAGGGVAGSVDEYHVQGDGQVTIVDFRTQSEQEGKKLKRRKVEKMIERMRALNPCENGWNEPGNVYYFLRMEEGGQVCGWTWGDPGREAPAEVHELYDELMNSLKK